MFERLKKSYIDGSLALSDYLYAVGAQLEIIEYIPEYLNSYDSELDIARLNVALNDCSIDEDLTTTQAEIIRETEFELTQFEKN